MVLQYYSPILYFKGSVFQSFSPLVLPSYGPTVLQSYTIHQRLSLPVLQSSSPTVLWSYGPTVLYFKGICNFQVKYFLIKKRTCFKVVQYFNPQSLGLSGLWISSLTKFPIKNKRYCKSKMFFFFEYQTD